MEADISLEKNSFEPNEEVKIDFHIDNTKCGKDVKSYKVKLHREIQVFKEKSKILFSKNEYLEEQKKPVDVKAKMKSDKTITFRIPPNDDLNKVGSLSSMHPTL